MSAGPEWAVCLHQNVALMCSLEECTAILEWTELHLVYNRRHGSYGQQLIQFAQAEIGDTNRAGIAQLTCPLHSRPRSGWAAKGPVHQVEIDILRAEPLQAVLRLDRWIRA